MRKMPLIMAACLILSLPVAPEKANSFIALWADSTQTECSVYPAVGVPFDVWIIVDPLEEGFVCAEFMLTKPSPSILKIAVSINPFFTLVQGDDPSTGVFVCAAECRTEAEWIYKITFLWIGQIAYDYLFLESNPSSGLLGTNSCAEGHPSVPSSGGLWFGINTYGWCKADTEESTWGAIKNIFAN